MTNPIMHTYAPLPISFEKGQGPWLWDKQGNQYLDTFGGIAVCALGHAHPAVTIAIEQQAKKLLHTSNAFEITHQIELAHKLLALSHMEKVFFCNSGAEANEAAFKLCRLYGHEKGIKDPAILVMEKGFHGRTLACISASGNRKVQAGFEPLVQGFIRAPYDDIAALENIAKNSPNIVAVFLEPIQGEAGIQVPSADFLPNLRQLCDHHHWLMALDEVQTGVGRTGKFFAYQHYDFLPDIVTSAKALGNGIPIGACLAKGTAAHLFKPGNHGTTFGGNPFSTKIALTVLETLEHEGLFQYVSEAGEYLMAGLKRQLSHHNTVVDIRGQGLMIGVELNAPCAAIKTLGLARGVLFNVTAEKVIRLVPPYTLTYEQMDRIIHTLDECIQLWSE